VKRAAACSSARSSHAAFAIMVHKDKDESDEEGEMARSPTVTPLNSQMFTRACQQFSSVR
jgi:hypothetical protein